MNTEKCKVYCKKITKCLSQLKHFRIDEKKGTPAAVFLKAAKFPRSN